VNIHPRCAAQLLQMPTCQAYPANQVNSMEGADPLIQPGARLKQPISNTCPWGLANVWRKSPSTAIRCSGSVTVNRQLRHTITGENRSSARVFSRVITSEDCRHTMVIAIQSRRGGSVCYRCRLQKNPSPPLAPLKGNTYQWVTHDCLTPLSGLADSGGARAFFVAFLTLKRTRFLIKHNKKSLAPLIKVEARKLRV
jgi:hypothetical protein